MLPLPSKYIITIAVCCNVKVIFTHDTKVFPLRSKKKITTYSRKSSSKWRSKHQPSSGRLRHQWRETSQSATRTQQVTNSARLECNLSWRMTSQRVSCLRRLWPYEWTPVLTENVCARHSYDEYFLAFLCLLSSRYEYCFWCCSFSLVWCVKIESWTSNVL